MIRFDLLTIFPQIFTSYLQESIIKRAIEKKSIEIVIHDIRSFSKDKHKKVDDTPYGGGPGMVMTPQPLYDAIEFVKQYNKGPVIYLSPKGWTLTQSRATKLLRQIMGKTSSEEKGLILVCGRYEGIDQRVIDLLVDEEVSIGRYVLTGGELPALVLIDVLARLVPGVLGDDESSREESFSKELKGKKEYPHYTRPPVFKGLAVPEVLLQGHHAKIKEWRKKQIQ